MSRNYRFLMVFVPPDLKTLVANLGMLEVNHYDFFFLIAGCIGSLGYWQSLATRESNKQHQWYCVPKESQVPIHYDLSHHNLCMTERMVHKREKRHNNTRKTKARKHQPPTKPTPTTKHKTIASTEVRREGETVLTRSVLLLQQIANNH